MKQKKKQKVPAKPTAALAAAPPAVSRPAQPESALALPEAAAAGQGHLDGEPYDPGNGEEAYYSDDAEGSYPDDADGVHPPGHFLANGSAKKSRKKRSKKGGGAAQTFNDYPHHHHHHNHHHPHGTAHGLPPPPPPPPALSQTMSKSGRGDKDRIWNTSTEEERGRIKEFWLSLGEDERKALVKIEKEAVLRKMKEQQKQSCSCTVCGRKRNAIEEELEVLYDAYYDELEQYAHSTVGGTSGERRFEDVAAHPMLPPPLSNGLERQPVNRIDPSRIVPSSHQQSRIRELTDEDDDDLEDDDDDDDDDLEDDEYSDEDYDDYSEDDLDFSPREPPHPPGPAQDLFNFGQHLTVKGGILTVADDLLKNDGKKFIDMMEQLAERRMAREEDAQYHAQAGAHHRSYAHEQGLAPEEEEYEDEEDEELDSQEDEYEEDEDMDSMTEEQRMQEGRRMFQIFAARMFEQRVLQAYRQKVSDERQAKLVLELEEEEKLKEEREAKKARDAQKKREKKKAQQQAKAEEKAKRDAEIAAQEAAKKAEEERKQEEQRKKKEEQRLKREAEKKAQDELKAKRDAERQKRQQEERERQQEAERKAREQKAAEKKARDEAKKKEREERQAREREERERKAQEERERKEREARQRAEAEAKEKARREEEAAKAAAAAVPPPPLTKRPSQMNAVAVPPGLTKQPSQSPRVAVATPAIPKAPTPKGPKQASRQASHGSSPKTPNAGMAAKPTSPHHPAGPHNPIQPKQILTKSHPPLPSQAQPPLPTSPTSGIMPPPGMNGPPGQFGGPPGFNAFPGQNMMPGMGRAPPMGQPMHGMFPHQNPPMGSHRGFPHVNGMPGGMNGANMMPIGGGAPPGFPQQNPIGTLQAGNQMPSFPGAGRDSLPSHSRQQSGSDKPFEKPYEPAPIGAPISRPAPIQRPSSVKPHEPGYEHEVKGADVEDLTQHLGSKALLADDDDVEPPEPGSTEGRRASTQIPSMPRTQTFSSPFPGSAQLHGHPFGGNTWGAPTPSMGGTPGLAGFGSPQMQATWGNHPFGSIGRSAGAQMAPGAPPGLNRPSAVRKLATQACRELNKLQPHAQFHDVNQLQQKMDAGRQLDMSPVSAAEIVQALESNKMGTPLNGGGRFELQRDQQNRAFVKFADDAPGAGGSAGNLGGLGVTGMGAGAAAAADVGSPVQQGAASAAAPFGGLGARPPFLANGQSNLGF